MSEIIRCHENDLNSLTPAIGDVVYVERDTGSNGAMIWTGTEWSKVVTDMNSEISMTAYEINQQIIHQLPVLTNEQCEKKEQMINRFCNSKCDKYFMLLCRELNYYTVVHRIGEYHALGTAGSLIMECAENVGQIKSIEPTEDGEAIEIWVDNLQGTYVMYFFPYDSGVELCQ